MSHSEVQFFSRVTNSSPKICKMDFWFQKYHFKVQSIWQWLIINELIAILRHQSLKVWQISLWAQKCHLDRFLYLTISELKTITVSQPHYGTCHQHHSEGTSEESDECDKPVNSVMQKSEFTASPNRSIDWIYWSFPAQQYS